MFTPELPSKLKKVHIATAQALSLLQWTEPPSDHSTVPLYFQTCFNDCQAALDLVHQSCIWIEEEAKDVSAACDLMKKTLIDRKPWEGF